MTGLLNESFTMWESAPDRWEVTAKIGEGAFGQVVKATDKATGKQKAIKRVRNFCGLAGKISVQYSRMITREIATLSMLQGCPNIVPLDLIYLSADHSDVYMVMPFVEFDLESVIKAKILKEEEIKWIAYQMLVGISHVHKKQFMHRDLTLRNILISDMCDTYIADFGLARAHETACEDITLDVVTLEYRAPELLLQYKKYDTRVDMWSIGCMIAELYLRRRLLAPARRDVPSQLLKLIQVFGKPDLEFVKSHASPSAAKFLENIVNKFEAMQNSAENKSFEPPIEAQLASAGASDGAVELIKALLQFDFRKRLPASEALKLDWFAKDDEYKDLEGVAGSEHEQPGSPLDGGAVTRMEEDGEIVEAHETLRQIQKLDLDGLRVFMESKATKVDNLVKIEYAQSAAVVAGGEEGCAQ